MNKTIRLAKSKPYATKGFRVERVSKIHLATWSLTVGLLILIFLINPQTLAAYQSFNEFVAVKAPKLELTGWSPGGQFGSSIAVGDLDGDGKDELVIGAPATDTNSRENNGAVYVFKDGKIQPVLYLHGPRDGSRLGNDVVIADLNNDGIDDLVMAAYGGGSGYSAAGQIFVYYGRKGLASQDSLDLGLNLDTVMFVGEKPGDAFGTSLASADVNGDQIEDLIIGAPEAKHDTPKTEGRVYVVMGNSETLKLRRFIDAPEGITSFGSDIDATSIGKDVFVVVGAPKSTVSGITEAGAVYLYKNSKIVYEYKGLIKDEWQGFLVKFLTLDFKSTPSLVISNFPLNNDEADKKVYVVGDLRAPQDSYLLTGDSAGSAISYDYLDIGSEDLVLGNPLATGPGGQSGTLEFRVTQKFTGLLYGQEIYDWFGSALSKGDFNDDGMIDLFVGARYADKDDGEADNGKVYILFGDSLRPNSDDKPVTTLLEDEPAKISVSRAKALDQIVKAFELKNKNEDYLESCYQYLDFCFFNFAAMSSFDGLQLKPKMRLYPDVDETNPYYDSIVVGTILGIVNGYMESDNSPFRPENDLTRVEALKITLSAAGLVPPKYKFELIETLGSYESIFTQTSFFKDIDLKISHMWWYPRYVNFAYEHDIVPRTGNFRPDDSITQEELDEMILNTKTYLKNP